MKITKFEELQIWQISIDLAKEIYDITSRGNWSRDFGLQDQVRRAIVSVSSNIAEGFEKSNNNEFVRFLRIAKGSIGEVRSQLYIALAIGYISQTEFNDLIKKSEDVSLKIGSFIGYLEKYKKDNSKPATR